MCEDRRRHNRTRDTVREKSALNSINIQTAVIQPVLVCDRDANLGEFVDMASRRKVGHCTSDRACDYLFPIRPLERKYEMSKETHLLIIY